jgi:hypothetical protein
MQPFPVPGKGYNLALGIIPGGERAGQLDFSPPALHPTDTSRASPHFVDQKWGRPGEGKHSTYEESLTLHTENFAQGR